MALHGITPRTAQRLRQILADGGRVGARPGPRANAGRTTWVLVTGEPVDGWYPGVVSLDDRGEWSDLADPVWVAGAGEDTPLTEGRRYPCSRTGDDGDGFARFRTVDSAAGPGTLGAAALLAVITGGTWGGVTPTNHTAELVDTSTGVPSGTGVSVTNVYMLPTAGGGGVGAEEFPEGTYVSLIATAEGKYWAVPAEPASEGVPGWIDTSIRQQLGTGLKVADGLHGVAFVEAGDPDGSSASPDLGAALICHGWIDSVGQVNAWVSDDVLDGGIGLDTGSMAVTWYVDGSGDLVTRTLSFDGSNTWTLAAPAVGGGAGDATLYLDCQRTGTINTPEWVTGGYGIVEHYGEGLSTTWGPVSGNFLGLTVIGGIVGAIPEDPEIDGGTW